MPKLSQQVQEDEPPPIVPPKPTTGSTEPTTQSPSSLFQYWWKELTDRWADAAGVNEIAVLKETVNDAARQVDKHTRTVQQVRQEVQKHTLEAEQLSTRHKQMVLLHREGTAVLTEDDVQQFAQLTAAESKARATATASLQSLTAAEAALHQGQMVYMDALRKRYHEEQVWQDKWRVLGTYWTWLLIGLNSVVFVAGQVLHWRREEARLQAIQTSLVQELQEQLLPQLATLSSSQPTTTSTTTRQQEQVSVSTDKPATVVSSKDEPPTNVSSNNAHDNQQDVVPSQATMTHTEPKDGARAQTMVEEKRDESATTNVSSSNNNNNNNNKTWKAVLSQWWTTNVAPLFQEQPIPNMATDSSDSTDRLSSSSSSSWWTTATQATSATGTAMVQFWNVVQEKTKTLAHQQLQFQDLHWPSVGVGAVGGATVVVVVTSLLWLTGSKSSSSGRSS